MRLNDNHPFLTHSQDVIEVVAPIKPLGVTYFSYSRHYKNGERLHACTHPKISESYYHDKYYLLGNTEAQPVSYVEQAVLWQTLPNQKVFECSRNFNIGNGFFFIQPQTNYCEFFSFAGDINNVMLINVYLTKMELLKNFICEFREKASNIIDVLEKSKIILPYHDGPGCFLDKIEPIQDRRIPRLTIREEKFGYLLLQGKTAKEIAQDMNISPRTVESYLITLKHKLNCENKTTLILKLSQMFAITSI